MCRSATSAPPSTHTAWTRGLPGGVWSRWFATRIVSIASRLAARNTSSFTSLGDASASIQIFRLGSLPCWWLPARERLASKALEIGSDGHGPREGSPDIGEDAIGGDPPTVVIHNEELGPCSSRQLA